MRQVHHGSATTTAQVRRREKVATTVVSTLILRPVASWSCTKSIAQVSFGRLAVAIFGDHEVAPITSPGWVSVRRGLYRPADTSRRQDQSCVPTFDDNGH